MTRLPDQVDAPMTPRQLATLRTLSAAWSRVPQGELQTTGYQINLLAGEYACEGDCINYFDERMGTYQFPIIIRAADGPGTATLLGGLNIANVR